MASSRSDLLRMGAVIALLLVATGGVLLATSGGSDDPGRAGGLPTMDGVLAAVDTEKLVLTPSGGGSPQTFDVRPIDARRLDLLHLQQHMTQQLPSRVHYLEEDGRRYAVRVDDLPSG
jgi:hypothetical protein